MSSNQPLTCSRGVDQPKKWEEGHFQQRMAMDQFVVVRTSELVLKSNPTHITAGGTVNLQLDTVWFPKLVLFRLVCRDT